MGKYVEFLKKEDFDTAKTNGSVEINGKTLEYSEESLYMVPDTTAEDIADIQAEQAAQSAKITAVETSVKKYYKHEVIVAHPEDTWRATLIIISSDSSEYITLEQVDEIVRGGYGTYPCVINYVESSAYGAGNYDGWFHAVTGVCTTQRADPIAIPVHWEFDGEVDLYSVRDTVTEL